MTEMFSNPPPADIRALLQRVKTIAVVGLSNSPHRPSHNVAAALQGFGYRIIPINPNESRVLGEQARPRLSDVLEPIDLVDVFRASPHVAGIVDECMAMGLPALWLQDGVINECAALRAQNAGIYVVMNRCVYRDYRQLM